MAIIVGGNAYRDDDHSIEFFIMGHRARKRISRKRVLSIALVGTVIAAAAGFYLGMR